jgi:mevalonate kinase
MKAIAEAPSKTIITGEHFVVHGAWALAAALPRRVRVEISPSSSVRVVSDRFTGSRAELRPVVMVIEALSREFGVKPGAHVRISSTVPEGAGLGSSASTMVAVCAAFSRLHSLGLGTDEVARYSMIGEREIHGNPSGIDSTICAKGGVLLFRPGSKPKPVAFDGRRSLLISYSGQKRSTKQQISRVREVKETYPALFALLSRSIGELSQLAARRLSEGDMEGLGCLLNVNHAVLSSLGVSNGTLDEMIDLLASLGAYGAKLTGAGGGGSVVGVCPKAKEKSIVSGLKARGFETFSADVPAEGVKSWSEQ